MQQPPDPTLGLHTMNKTYSNPSGPMDFMKSVLTGATVLNAIL